MPRKFKRNGRWYLAWWDRAQKKEIRRSLGQITQAEATEALRLKNLELRRQALASVVELPTVHVPTFEQFAEDYLTWYELEHPASYDRVESIFGVHLIPYFGSTELDRITKAQAERYKAQRKGKAETIGKEMRQLQAALNRAVFLELIEKNPIKGVKPPRALDSKPPRWYTADELAAIYANSKPLAGDEAKRKKGGPAPVNALVPDYAPIWKLLANTGLRRTEAMQLKWIEVGEDSIRVLSSEGARTKSGKWRQIPLSEGAREALEALRQLTGTKPHVLPKMHAGSLSRAFDTARKRAELDGSLHCLRHTFCAHLVMNGVPLRTVQVLAGHAHFSTTEKYAHLAPGHLQDAVKGLSL